MVLRVMKKQRMPMIRPSRRISLSRILQFQKSIKFWLCTAYLLMPLKMALWVVENKRMEMKKPRGKKKSSIMLTLFYLIIIALET